MATDIRMPELSEAGTEADLIAWLVKPGERIEQGDVIAEVETDKSTVELEAEAAGVLVEILVPAGTSGVAVGTVLARIEAEQAESAQAPLDAALPAAATTAEAAADAATEPMPGPAAATALARRLAEQAGLDLAGLSGSGAAGRIVKADVERALRGAAVCEPFAPLREAAAPPPAIAETPAATTETPHVEIPHSRMRRTIAARLGEAKREVPHFYLRVDCRTDALLSMRRSLNEQGPECRISVNDFVLRAVALSLVEVPEANVAWSDSGLLRFERVDLAVAVATEGGLITPIVRGAEGKGLQALSSEVRSLAERARAGRLRPSEYRGGTFCVSNLGMYGIDAVAPILNPPQSGILGVGAAREVPVVENGRIAVGSVMTCVLSADHRAVDGAVGATFLAAVKKRIEQPLEMLF